MSDRIGITIWIVVVNDILGPASDVPKAFTSRQLAADYGEKLIKKTGKDVVIIEQDI